MKLKILARPAAERLVSLSTRAPVIQLTGAEIAVLLGSLDDVDRACVEALERITGVEATEKRLEEVIKDVLLTDLKIERKEADVLAGKVVDRLKKLWILRTVHSRRVLSIPKGWVSIRITRDASFFLFAGKDLKQWLKKKKDTIFVSGTALGYAYCKSRSDDAVRMALEIAKELSVENPLTPLKHWHFECVHPNELEMCEACLTGRGRERRKWVKAGKMAVNLYRLYQTEAGRAALYLIRKNMCRIGGEEDERKLKAIKNNAIRNAEKRIDELKAEISPLEISRLPVEKDDSVSFINYPEHAIRKGKICGLALSIAASWYGEGDDADCEAVDAVLRAIMDLRHVITPDVRDALRLLAERIKERNKALSGIASLKQAHYRHQTLSAQEH